MFATLEPLRMMERCRRLCGVVCQRLDCCASALPALAPAARARQKCCGSTGEHANHLQFWRKAVIARTTAGLVSVSGSV